MDKNIDQYSAVECTAAQPRLTKSPIKEEKSLYVFSVQFLLLALVERFGVSHMRDFFNIKIWFKQIGHLLILGHHAIFYGEKEKKRVTLKKGFPSCFCIWQMMICIYEIRPQ